MRKINGKYFLLLLLGGVATLGIAVLVHHFQYGRVANALLWQARQAEEQGQPKRSAEYYQRYLEFKPTDTEEKARLAKIWTSDAYPVGSRARAQAVKLLDALLTNQDDPELRRLLVKTALEIGDYRLASEHLPRLLSWEEMDRAIVADRDNSKTGKPLAEIHVREDVPRGELELFWGQVLENEKKPAEAIHCYRLASRHARNQPEAYVRLAYLLRRNVGTSPATRQRLQTDADTTMNDMVRRNADNCDAFLARWRYRREFDLLAIREAIGRGELALEEAAQDVSESIKRRPDSIEVILVAADLERLRGRSVAEAFSRPAEERRAKMKEHRQKALEHLRHGLELIRNKKSPSNEYSRFQLLWHKGNLHLDDLDIERAAQKDDSVTSKEYVSIRDEIEQVIEQVRKTHMPAAAEYMKGRLQLNEHHWAEAAVLFERARTQMATQRDLACQANLYLGQCYERLQEPVLMYAAFNRVTDQDPTAVPAILGKAAARWAQGHLEDALAYYKIAMQQKAVPPRAYLDIARLEIQRQGQQQKENWQLADRALESAGKFLAADHLELVLLRAEVALRKNKVDKAREILETAQNKNPAEVEFRTALVDIALREKKADLAKEILQGGRETVGDLVALRLSEARVLAAVEGKKAVAKIVELCQDRDKFSLLEQGRLLSGLADTLFRMGSPAEARKMWTSLTALPRHKSDLHLRMLLFDLAMKMEDKEGMLQTLDDIQKIEQNTGTYHSYGEALLLIWESKREGATDRQGKLEQARTMLDAVLQQRPSWSAVYLARAEISKLNGTPEQAIKDLKEAIRHGDKSPLVVQNLAALLTESGHHAEAQLVLANLHESLSNNPDIGRLGVLLALRRGDMNQAVTLMHKAVREKETKDPKQMLWMGRVLATAQRYVEAEKYLRDSIALQGDNPESWVALVQLLSITKKTKEALVAIEEMKAKIPAAKLPFALARCQDALGKGKEAVKSYAMALAGAKEDPELLKAIALGHLTANRSAQAEPILRRLAASKIPGTVPGDIDWAKRSLALILAGGTSYKRFGEALELVGLNLDANGRLPDPFPATASTAMRRTQARVLAAQNQKQFRQQAIKILEELSRARVLAADDEFVLAMLYDANGEPRKTHERLKALIQLRTRTAHYLAQYIMNLIVQRPTSKALDEAEEATGWLTEMENQQAAGSNGFASVELRARLLEARGKGDEALTLLRDHRNRKEGKPEETLLVIASLSRQKRYAEALALCEKTWEEGKIVPEAMGAVSVALLRVMGPSDAQVAAVEKRLRAAMKKKPDATVLLLHLADLYDRRGQYDKAAAQYREVLKREENNVVALNNLAWLLAHRDKGNRAALGFIDKAIKGMGRRPDLLDTRGMVLLAAKQTSKALEDLREATAEAPTPARLYHLARALHEEKNKTRADEVLRQAKAKGLDPSTLHPAEQDDCRKLLSDYGLR